jgi:hypothetical protein
VGCCEHVNVSLSSLKCGEFLEKTRNYSRRTLLHGVKELASSVGWLVGIVIETWYTNQTMVWLFGLIFL